LKIKAHQRYSLTRKLVQTVMCFFILFCLDLKAQSFYTTDTAYIKLKSEGDNLLHRFQNFYPDSSVFDLHNFTERNTLGSLGLSTHLWRFKFGTEALGFRLYPLPYDESIISKSKILYYNTKGPFASANGIAGSKEQQLFRFLFTHTFPNRVNVGLKFNRYTNTGFYKNQRGFVNNFYFNSNYETKNQRFGYYGFVLVNNVRHGENGGLKNDSDFIKNVSENKIILSTNLTNAGRDNRLLTTQLNPYFLLNKRDSSSTQPYLYLQLKSSYTFNRYKYKDLNSGGNPFYSIFYLDTLTTNDSTRFRQYMNEMYFTFQNAAKTKGVSLGYTNELNLVWQKNDSTITNHHIKANAHFEKSFLQKDSISQKQIQLFSNLEASVIFTGANSGNFKLESKNNLCFSKNNHASNLFFNLLTESRSADYIYNRWYSNHLVWKNSFKAVQQFQAELGYAQKNISAVVFAQSITNVLYFDSLSLPKQFNSSITNIGINALYRLILFKHLGFSLQPTFQTSSKPSIYRMPLLSGKVNLFYTSNLFKNALQLTLGSQLETYSTYELMRYNPMIQQFYLGNRRETGYYPYVDVYLNARIRPVSFFIKVENLLFGNAGSGYYFVPGYIQTDRAFRFGLTWLFFD
jgi:hypothetical protein